MYLHTGIKFKKKIRQIYSSSYQQGGENFLKQKKRKQAFVKLSGESASTDRFSAWQLYIVVVAFTKDIVLQSDNDDEKKGHVIFYEKGFLIATVEVKVLLKLQLGAECIKARY